VAFPDQRHEKIALRLCDDAVVVEFFRGFGKLSREPKDVIPDTPALTARGST